MRRSAFLLIAVAVLGLCAETLRLSSTRLYPRYDEVSYLALARDFAREGGIVGTVRCYLDGRCREEGRPPLYQFLLASVADNSERFFDGAKLIRGVPVLLLLAVVAFALRRSFSGAVADGSVIALTLMPVVPDVGASVLHDVLYAALPFAAVFTI